MTSNNPAQDELYMGWRPAQNEIEGPDLVNVSPRCRETSVLKCPL